jgi:hypothetical protein
MASLLQRIRLRAKLGVISMLFFGGVGLVPAASAAALPLYVASAGTTAACSALSQLDTSQACGSGQSTINKVVKSITEIIALVLGVTGVIMVVVAGFKYITSNGDTQAVGSAKRTLIYALVGLVVAVLAEFLVHFVLNAAAKATG